MMDNSFSGFDSDLSLDSLECQGTVISESKSLCKNSTLVPYYSGEVLLKDIEKFKHGYQHLPRSLDSKIPTYKKPLISHSTCSSLRSVENEIGPTFTYFPSDKPSRATDIRTKARRSIILHRDQIVRPRHKSVSYVDQFRKKHSSTQKLKTSTLSIADSEPGQSLSLESCGNKDCGFETSEFGFFEDMMLQPQSTKIDMSFSELNDTLNESPSVDLRITPKKKKEKFVVLKGVDIIGRPSEYKVEKKSSIERREEYATKVKARNQMNFNRQKEKEQRYKCLTKNNVSVCLNDDERKITKDTKKDCDIPFTCPLAVLGHKSDRTKARKIIRRKFEKQNKKPQDEDEGAKLEVLRKRHEQEKQLVNSLRQLILKA